MDDVCVNSFTLEESVMPELLLLLLLPPPQKQTTVILCVNRKRRSRENLYLLLDKGRNLKTEDKEKAELLNHYFASVLVNDTSCFMSVHPL